MIEMKTDELYFVVVQGGRNLRCEKRQRKAYEQTFRAGLYVQQRLYTDMGAFVKIFS